jgi:hypothetical protein
MEEWLFHRELLTHGQGIHRKNGVPPGINSSFTRNPPKEGDFTGSYQLIDADSDQIDQNTQKSLRTLTIPGKVMKI